jgi:hypothetical protein
MHRIVLCDNKNCSKYKECFRSMCEIADNVYIEFKNVCNERNNYQYYYEIGDKPIRKEELP